MRGTEAKGGFLVIPSREAGLQAVQAGGADPFDAVQCIVAAGGAQTGNAHPAQQGEGEPRRKAPQGAWVLGETSLARQDSTSSRCAGPPGRPQPHHH